MIGSSASLLLLSILSLALLPNASHLNSETLLQATTRPTDHSTRRTSVCNPTSEYACATDNACVPTAWRCDFTEQCPNGDDELGCVPDTCTFAHDFCALIDEHRLMGTSHQQQQQPTKQHQDGIAWRRYLSRVLLPSRSPSHPTNDAHMHVQLERLAEAPAEYARVKPHIDDNTSAARRLVFAPFPPSVSTTNSPARVVQKQQSYARLRTPTIGQTASMCQIRFAYAFWLPSSGRGGTDIDDEDDEAPKDELRLEVRAHQNSTLVTTLWTRTSTKSTLDWQLGVIELGHARLFELEFVAYNTRTMTRPGFVALRWLHFDRCAWPQTGADYARARDTEAAVAAAQAQTETDWPFAADELFSALDVELDPQSVSLTTAQPTSASLHCKAPRKFHCATSGMCLDEHQLCNFVSDCMSRPVDFRDTKTTTKSADDDDEVPQLCAPVLGRETFEQPANNTALTKYTQAGREFWTRAGNWPARIMNASTRRPPLWPRADHTTNMGHFLSVDLPPSSTDAQRQRISWLYLDSPWLVKLEGAECRVKLFYNLVVPDYNPLAPQSNPLGYSVFLIVEHLVLDRALGRGRNSSSSMLGIRKRVDGFNYASEHAGEWPSQHSTVVLARHVWPVELAGADFWRELNYKLDDLLDDGEVFFVRIALVYVSAANSHLERKPLSGSFNIDDLSLHFGCALADNLNKLRPMREYKQSLTGKFELSDYLHATDSSGVVYYGPNNKRLLDDDDDAALGSLGSPHAQLEPHKLVLYVFGSLSVMLMVIVLIVFVIVPRVEQLTMSYHDQLAAGVSEIMDESDVVAVIESAKPTPSGNGGGRGGGVASRALTSSVNDASADYAHGLCELGMNAVTSLESDWEQVARPQHAPTNCHHLIATDATDEL